VTIKHLNFIVQTPQNPFHKLKLTPGYKRKNKEDKNYFYIEKHFLIHPHRTANCSATIECGERYSVVSIWWLAEPLLRAVKKVKKKGKSIHVTGRGSPWSCKTTRLQQFLENRLTDDGEVVSLTRRPPFTPRNIPSTHFC
jgi:hypothetical protein